MIVDLYILIPCNNLSLSSHHRVLEPAEICDLLKGIILISCCIMMMYIDVSMLYHIVRGQAIIKLYIFFNMLEVSILQRENMLFK